MIKKTESDHNLEAVSKIFNVMDWGKIIPPCYFSWISKNLKEKNWKLKVIPFMPIICDSKVENNGVVDVRYYDCGFFRLDKGYSMGGFKNKHISKGQHDNLHQVIHCLHRAGIDFFRMVVEENFEGCKVDILGETEEKKYIAVELGKLSKIGKFSLIYEDNVKEFWFGDTMNFIYSLSRKTPKNNELLGDENKSQYILNYKKSHCDMKQRYECSSSSYHAFNCRFPDAL